MNRSERVFTNEERTKGGRYWLDRSIFRNWWKKEKFNGTASNRFRWPRYSWARNAFEIQTSGGDRRCQLNRGGKRTLNPLRKKLWECVCGITLHFEGAAYGSLAIFPGFNWISYVGISIRANPLVVDGIALSQAHRRNAIKCPLLFFIQSVISITSNLNFKLNSISNVYISLSIVGQ